MARPLKNRITALLTAGIIASLSWSCSVTQSAADTKDISYIYNPARNVFTPHSSVFNEDAETSLLTIAIRRGELYFSQANPQGVPLASMLISVRLFNNTLGVCLPTRPVTRMKYRRGI